MPHYTNYANRLRDRRLDRWTMEKSGNSPDLSSGAKIAVWGFLAFQAVLWFLVYLEGSY